MEGHLEIYKNQNNIIDLTAQSDLFLTSVKDQDAALNQLNIQLSTLDEVEKYLDGKGTNPGTVPSLMGISDPVLTMLLPKLYEMEFEWRRKSQIAGANDEQLLVLKDEILKAKSAIRENVRNIRVTLLNMRSKVQTNINQQMDNKPLKIPFIPSYFRNVKNRLFHLHQQLVMLELLKHPMRTIIQ